MFYSLISKLLHLALLSPLVHINKNLLDKNLIFLTRLDLG
jgi:hypothetical protein